MISQRLVEDGIIEGNSILTISEGEKANDENGKNSDDNPNGRQMTERTAIEKAALRRSQRMNSPLENNDNTGNTLSAIVTVDGGDIENPNLNGIQEGVVEEERGESAVNFSQKLQKYMKSILSCLYKVGSHYVYRGILLFCLLLDLLFLSLAILGFNEYRLW